MAKRAGRNYPHKVTSNPMLSGGDMGKYVEIQSNTFPGIFGGHDTIAVPPLQMYDSLLWGFRVPAPLFVFNDLIRAGNDEGTGLVYEAPGDPDEPIWVRIFREMFFPRVQAGIFGQPNGRPLSIYKIEDDHIHNAAINKKGLTKFQLHMEQLNPSQRQLVSRRPDLARKQGTTELLTVEEYEYLFGMVVDVEDLLFLPHAHHGLVRSIPTMENWVKTYAQSVVAEAHRQGENRVKSDMVVDIKTSLMMGNADNVFYQAMEAFFNGIYTEGKSHRGLRAFVVAGTAGEYTNFFRDTILASDIGGFVIVPMWLQGTLGFESYLKLAYDNKLKYGARIIYTFDWVYPEVLGPKPAGFDAMVAQIKMEMFEAEFGPQGTASYRDAKSMLAEYKALQAEIDRITKLNAQNGTALPVPVIPLNTARVGAMMDEVLGPVSSMFWKWDKIQQYLLNGGE